MIVVNSRFLTQKITGVQRNAIEISRELRKLYPDITFISPKNIYHRNIASELNAILFGRLRGHLWEQIDLHRYLNKNKNPLLLNLANTAPISYKNQIVTICDLSFLRHPEWFSKNFYFYYRFLIPKIAKNSLKIVTISKFSKNEIMDLLHVPEHKIKVIYCGVNSKFIPTTFGSAVALNRYKKYILAVSSFDPRKNFKNLISAFKMLNLKDTQLLIVGSKQRTFAYHDLKKFIHADQNIIFTGHISDEELITLYKNATLFVFPALYEGFGLPPLEAMACGCPVVVSHVASIPEVCEDAAYYVDPYNIESIAEGMQKVLTDGSLQQSMRKKGLKRAKLFSWEKSAKEYVRVFEEILKS